MMNGRFFLLITGIALDCTTRLRRATAGSKSFAISCPVGLAIQLPAPIVLLIEHAREKLTGEERHALLAYFRDHPEIEPNWDFYPKLIAEPNAQVLR